MSLPTIQYASKCFPGLREQGTYVRCARIWAIAERRIYRQVLRACLTEGTTFMYDVIVVGGSFAGLAVAMQLRGRRVLIVDQRAIGTHQTSTCAAPVSLAQQLGTLSSLLEEHRYVVLHTGGQETGFKLEEPYFTFDYFAFCRAMLAQTDAEVLIATATSIDGGEVATTQGPFKGRFVVDASGWQPLHRRRAGPGGDVSAAAGSAHADTGSAAAGCGVETELPVRVPLDPGLHFYAEKSIVRNGYAWVFPCGASTRIGVCTFDRGVSIKPVLDAFLGRFGLQRAATHGGGMPVYRREPLAGEVLVVGDAAGQCVPLWAEGIRSAIFYSTVCGREIAAGLDGLITDDEARRHYAQVVRGKQAFRNTMLALQQSIAWAPEWLRAGLCAATCRVQVGSRLRRLNLTWASPPGKPGHQASRHTGLRLVTGIPAKAGQTCQICRTPLPTLLWPRALTWGRHEKAPRRMTGSCPKPGGSERLFRRFWLPRSSCFSSSHRMAFP